jgi:drug/metabolite transporter (DMT)-like permease
LSATIGVRAAMGETIAADLPSVISVLAAGVANALALASLALAVRAAPVATVNTISSGSIVLSFLASVFIFGESGSPPMVLGITLVTAGIVVAQLRRRIAGGTDGDAATEAKAATPPGAAT